jgi:hypothetical protein
MHDLEGKVMPFLGPMISHGRAIALSEQQASDLAAWAYKTIMVFESLSSSYEPHFLAQERYSFSRTINVPGVGSALWLGQYSGPDNFLTADLSFDLHLTGDGGTLSGHSLTLAIGKVSLQIVVIRNTAIFRRFEGEWLRSAIQVWPFQQGFNDFRWPPLEPMDNKRFYRFAFRWGGFRTVS